MSYICRYCALILMLLMLLLTTDIVLLVAVIVKVHCGKKGLKTKGVNKRVREGCSSEEDNRKSK